MELSASVAPTPNRRPTPDPNELTTCSVALVRLSSAEPTWMEAMLSRSAVPSSVDTPDKSLTAELMASPKTSIARSLVDESMRLPAASTKSEMTVANISSNSTLILLTEIAFSQAPTTKSITSCTAVSLTSIKTELHASEAPSITLGSLVATAFADALRKSVSPYVVASDTVTPHLKTCPTPPAVSMALTAMQKLPAVIEYTVNSGSTLHVRSRSPPRVDQYESLSTRSHSMAVVDTESGNK
mmetsp:Transcript_27768/g.73330  ORF Transcript_27768/g.73330 Transcript_27768/m.73330 type:complete len:242 (-) Transcript_27768:2043-2768(-)